jgi:enoyl-CoA hydratase
MLSAEEAQRIGLANRIFEPGELLEKSVEVGEAIAGKGPVAVRVGKRVLQQGADADVRVAHALEQSAFGGIFASEDHHEGIAAFLEKRDPKFEGR